MKQNRDFIALAIAGHAQCFTHFLKDYRCESAPHQAPGSVLSEVNITSRLDTSLQKVERVITVKFLGRQQPTDLNFCLRITGEGASVRQTSRCPVIASAESSEKQTEGGVELSTRMTIPAQRQLSVKFAVDSPSLRISTRTDKQQQSATLGDFAICTSTIQRLSFNLRLPATYSLSGVFPSFGTSDSRFQLCQRVRNLRPFELFGFSYAVQN